MRRMVLYRNVRARGSLELFLLSAITSLLTVRFYLNLTGYPQLGGDSLHIAHMLWGGLLMLVGLIVSLSFLGARVQWLTALVGGAGFGVFIDEIGKFITHDNNYFFQPAIGIIYAIFVILYLFFNFLGREQRLTTREYQLNALAQLEEAVATDMDPGEKARVLELLNRADDGVVTKKLRQLVEAIDVVKPRTPGPLERLRLRRDDLYQRFWHSRESSLLVRSLFIFEAAVLLFGVLVLAFGNIDDLLDAFRGSLPFSLVILAGQMASAAIAAGFALYGAWLLRRNRVRAFEQLRRATLINLLLTQFFLFYRDQFAAMPGFVFNLFVLLVITYVMHQERRLRAAKDEFFSLD